MPRPSSPISYISSLEVSVPRHPIKWYKDTLISANAWTDFLNSLWILQTKTHNSHKQPVCIHCSSDAGPGCQRGRSPPPHHSWHRLRACRQESISKEHQAHKNSAGYENENPSALIPLNSSFSKIKKSSFSGRLRNYPLAKTNKHVFDMIEGGCFQVK